MLAPGWLRRLDTVSRIKSHAEQEELASLFSRRLFCLFWYMAKWVLLFLVSGFMLGWRNMAAWTVRDRGILILAVGLC